MRPPLAFVVCLLCASGAALVLGGRPGHPGGKTANGGSGPVLPSPPDKPAQRKLVLAGHASTYTLGSALAQGTGIGVEWAWPEDAMWADQLEVPVSERAAEANAVLTLRHAAPDDMLYAAARARNFSVVEIDATLLADLRTSGVRLADTSRGGPAPAAPLSLSNAAKMAEAIARDFARLSPPDAERVAANLRTVKERLFRLRAAAEARLADAENIEVGVTAPVFQELASDLGLLVRPPNDPAIAAVLSAYNTEEGAGRPVVVLDLLNGAPSGPEHYFESMARNLTAVADALLAPASTPD